MDTELLTFSHNHVERKARRVNIGDYKASREAIRRERLASVILLASPEVNARTAAQPISGDELFDWMFSPVGLSALVYRCVGETDQTFTQEEADIMVMEDDPFVMRLLIESKVLVKKADPTPVDSPPSKPPSSGVATAPGKSTG